MSNAQEKSADCFECRPTALNGVDNRLLRLLDLWTAVTSHPCCQPQIDQVVQQLSGVNGRRLGHWSLDSVPNQIRDILGGESVSASELLLLIRDWHEENSGSILDVSASRLVMPTLLFMDERLVHGGGVERADAHVHHGGIFSFEDILEFRRPIRRSDTFGVKQRNCWGALTAILRDPDAYSMAGDAFHETLYARDPRVSNAASAKLARHSNSYRQNAPLNVRRFVSDSSIDPMARELVAVLVSYLYRLVKIPHQGGFSTFFEMFDGLAPDKAAGSARYVRPLRRHARRAGVCRLELRKNGSALPVLRQLAELSLAQPIEPAMISVPTGFSRKLSREDRRGDDAVFRRALLPIPEIDPIDERLVPYLGSFDINGPENRSVPSWLLALWFCRVEQSLVGASRSLSFTVHAGETWDHPFSGLRRIGETGLFPDSVRPSRIGHGLALDSVLTELCERHAESAIGSCTLADARFDALWAVSVGLTGVDDLARFGWLFRSPIADLVGAYRLLFSKSEYGARGWLLPGVSGVVAPLPELAGGATIRLEQFADSMEVRDFGRWLQSLTVQARELVASQLRAAGTIIETCPSSNVWIGRAGWFDSHPFGRFSSDDLQVTVNTDNPGFFETDVAAEEELLRVSLGGDAIIASYLARARELSMNVPAGNVATNDWAAIREALGVARSGGRSQRMAIDGGSSRSRERK